MAFLEIDLCEAMEKREAALEEISHTFIIGISGISSSGKTTLARYLRRLFITTTIPISSPDQPGTVIEGASKITFNVSLLHEDDFFIPESSLPVRQVALKRKNTANEETEGTVEMTDWDFPGAIDFAGFKKALQLLHQGVPYADVVSTVGIKETEGPESTEIQLETATLENGGKTVSEQALNKIREAIVSKFNSLHEKHSGSSTKDHQVNLIIVDGFMLYHRDEDEAKQTSPPLVSLLDLKLLLRASYTVAKERRESRNGYITADGFWTDPEGYFDGIVWPNYVRFHRHLFVGGDVEGGTLTEDWGSGGRGVELQPQCGGMEDLLRWASGRVAETIAGGWGTA